MSYPVVISEASLAADRNRCRDSSQTLHGEKDYIEDLVRTRGDGGHQEYKASGSTV